MRFARSVDADRDAGRGTAQTLAEVWISCSRCPAFAAFVTLYGVPGGFEVVRRSFTSTLTQPLAAEAAERVRAAIYTESGAAAALFAVDPELVPCYCPDCGFSYCGDHWETWLAYDDDIPHWIDSIRGRCPEGHERMLED